jgi:hypothetical protein
MATAASTMASLYSKLKTDAAALIQEIKGLPAGLNETALLKAGSLLQFADQRTHAAVDLGFDVKDRYTKFTWSEILSFNELYFSKKTELEILKAGLLLIKPAPVPGPATQPPVNKYSSTLPGRNLKVSAYKQWLQQELQKLAAANDNDDVVLNN